MILCAYGEGFQVLGQYELAEVYVRSWAVAPDGAQVAICYDDLGGKTWLQRLNRSLKPRGPARLLPGQQSKMLEVPRRSLHYWGSTLRLLVRELSGTDRPPFFQEAWKLLVYPGGSPDPSRAVEIPSGGSVAAAENEAVWILDAVDRLYRVDLRVPQAPPAYLELRQGRGLPGVPHAAGSSSWQIGDRLFVVLDVPGAGLLLSEVDLAERSLIRSRAVPGYPLPSGKARVLSTLVSSRGEAQRLFVSEAPTGRDHSYRALVFDVESLDLAGVVQTRGAEVFSTTRDGVRIFGGGRSAAVYSLSEEGRGAGEAQGPGTLIDLQSP